ncbi:MAG: SDR family oxidoreductase [Chloroflexota bacterium]
MAERTLAGKIAWVTGSSRGIGRVVADHLASLGADVAIHGTSPYTTRTFQEAESLPALAESMAKAHGVRVIPVCGDLTDEATVNGIVAEIHEKLGPIDILVNSAGGDIGAQGITGPNAGKPAGNNALDISLQDIRTVLDRNIMTCILCCRAVGAEMRARRTGWIVNIGSIAGLSGHESEAIYSTAKAAVHEYTRCLAAMLRPYDVHVNAVAPGGTLSPRFIASRPIDESRKVTAGTLDRYGWPMEMATVVAFLVTPASSFMTGQVLRVDGGSQLFPA